MENEQKIVENKVRELIEKSIQPVPGLIRVKELNENTFINNLFKHFIITSPNLNSTMKIRAGIQGFLRSNLQDSIGMYHSKELSNTCFLNDLFKNFTLTPKIE